MYSVESVPADAYFASEKDVTKLCERVCGRLSEYNQQRGRQMQGWDSVHQHLYGESIWLERDGDEGELVSMKVPKSKALLKSLGGLLLGPPLTWRPQARNSDVEARSSVLMTANLCEFLYKQHGLGVFCGEWIEAGLAFREAYALPTWDMGLGKAVGVAGYSAQGGQLLFGGGLRIRLVLPWDVFFDAEYRSWEELPWVCVRTWENKHRLAALESDETRAEAIRSLGGDWLSGNQTRRNQNRLSPDVIPVYHLWHKDTPEVPGGLYLPFLTAALPLTPQKCDDIPLERFAPSSRLDSPFGDSQWQGTLKIEQMVDGVHSSLASNMAAYGTQAISIDSRDSISRDKVNNLLVFERMPGSQFDAKALQLTQNPAGFDKILEMWNAASLDTVGLNDVQQGAPPGAQMNAEAFALLASMAVQRNGAVQRRALDSIGRLGSKVLGILAESMSEDEAVAIAGKAARLNYPLQGMSKSKLGAISSVYVEVGNPLEQTAGGRLQMYRMIQQAYADAGKNLPPEAIPEIIETGRYEEPLRVERDEDLFVQWENDQILQGITPVVDFSDDHLKHGRSHRGTTLTPAARGNTAIIQANDQHLMGHYANFFSLPPGVNPRQDPQFSDRIRVLLGQTAPGQVGPPPPAGGPPQPPGGPNPPSDQPPGPPPALQPPMQPPKGPAVPEAPPTVLPPPNGVH